MASLLQRPLGGMVDVAVERAIRQAVLIEGRAGRSQGGKHGEDDNPPLRPSGAPQGAMRVDRKGSPPPTRYAGPLKGAMRVDRQSWIHCILGLVPLSWVWHGCYRWLPAVATVIQSKKRVLDPGNRGSGFASPPVSPPGGRA
ncbi:hypothetical protein GCM10009097_31110 [Pigmentiphaga daeguensis]|uniref:Uncharacterized protein n=1 Tax=Pigmentiphaga daeguensis TaxID=414049 RepID=A0ABN1C674_9BURK